MSRLRSSATVLLFAALLSACGRHETAAPAPLMDVVVKAVQPEDVPVAVTMVGRIVSDNSITFAARVTGQLIEAPFTGGGMVKAGDVLFRIDPAQYQAELDSALARQAQAEAKLAKAENDLARVDKLFKTGGMPQQEVDDASTAKLAATADVRSAQAAVTTARLTLGYTTITAPFAGRVGQAPVSVGALITPQSGALLTLDQIDPIDINFTVSEEGLLSLRTEIAAGRVVSAGVDHFVVTATLLDGSVYEHLGKISFADIRFQPETGSAQAQAKFPNPTGKLLPGQFARISVSGITRKDALLVPQGAVVQSPTGASVYVVGAGDIVESRTVKLGGWVDNRWRIIDGLKAGDRVVVGGVQKVRAGAKVHPVSGS
jgi:membrane fusion protein (multidrug efflux system)